MRFEVVMGVNEGYENQTIQDPDEAMRVAHQAWILEMSKEFEASGKAISSFMTPVLVSYMFEGFPRAEVAVLIAGNMNQALEECKVSWIDSTKRVVDAVRKRLKQKTALLSFDGDEQYYLRDAE